MSNEELTEALAALREQLWIAQRQIVMLETKCGTLEHFLKEKYGEPDATRLKQLFRVNYDWRILQESKRDRLTADRLDMRTALPEDEQADWYAPDLDVSPPEPESPSPS